MDGVTATTAELNIMDGVTATTAELNYVDGVTSNVQTQLNAKAANHLKLFEWETGTAQQTVLCLLLRSSPITECDHSNQLAL